MASAYILVLLLVTVVVGQQVGNLTPENHPPISFQKCANSTGCSTINGAVVLDSNWRWTHATTGNYPLILFLWLFQYFNVLLQGTTTATLAMNGILHSAPTQWPVLLSVPLMVLIIKALMESLLAATRWTLGMYFNIVKRLKYDAHTNMSSFS